LDLVDITLFLNININIASRGTTQRFKMASPNPKTTNKTTHRVSFSEMSQMFVYEDDELYHKNVAYSQQECNAIGVKTLLEKLRIQNLMSSTPYGSRRDSLRFLMKTKLVSIDELIGIEDVLLPPSVINVRENHSRALLQKQHELAAVEDPVKCLAQFAEKSSFKSIHLARIRAAMAAVCDA